MTGVYGGYMHVPLFNASLTCFYVDILFTLLIKFETSVLMHISKWGVYYPTGKINI